VKPKLKVLDLFAGAGGFSVGLEKTGGFETVAFCEIEPFAQQILKKNWPHVRLYDDITTAEFSEPVDLVTGGFPCQDISFAGEGAGLEGERSGLFWHILRTAGLVGFPKLLLENVAALLNRGLGTVLGALAQIGYDAEWHCIQAADVGAPHLRDRVWIIADARRKPWTQPILTKNHVLEAREKSAAIWRKNRKLNEMASIQPEVLKGRLDKSKTYRMDDGIQNWPHRLRVCGNAVIPQIPEMIGHAILATEST
jgi:DNA (cytosine-5)-methyltransferase 1